MEFYSPEFAKANAMKRNNRLKNMALLLEFVVCLVLLMLLSWSTFRTPINMTEFYNAGYLLKELGSVFNFTSRSVFIITNVIIILVFVQSCCKLPGPHHQQQPTEQQLHHHPSSSYSAPSRMMAWIPVGKEKAEHVKPEPVGITVVEVGVRKRSNDEENVKENESAQQLYRRTMSASYERSGVKKKGDDDQQPVVVERRELRRSKTVKWGGGQGVNNGEKKMSSTRLPEGFDELSHDEFRRKIEAFIAKQQRMIREESLQQQVVGRSRSEIVSRRRL